MAVFSLTAFDEHEQVAFCSDADTGLKAIIAVHSTTLGPAVGGCRMWPYATDDEALVDVLRLSRGMSYKNAMADLGFGGGKSVIIGDSRTDKTPALMRAFGSYVHRLGGSYITAEDVGMTVQDMEYVAESTPYVTGLTKGEAASGDPSPFTAHGVVSGIRAAVQHRLKTDDFSGLRVMVQGLGHVGYGVARELHEMGAQLFVSDIRQDSVARATEELRATAVAPDNVYDIEADVFAPCALGAGINDDTIPRLKVSVVAGAANNQLAEDRHGAALRDRGILYAPDYVINAGGMMSVANEIKGIAVDHDTGMRNVERLYDVLLEVFQKAEAEGRPTHEVADAIAEAKIAAAKREEEAA